MKLDFETRMSILSVFLSGYYWIEYDGVISSSETDCCVYNVMELEGRKDDIIQDGDEYYTNLDITNYDTLRDEDVVCNEWYGEWYSDCSELSNQYADSEDYTIIWIHPVKRGSVTLIVDTGEILGDENTKYDTSQAFVVVGGEVFPLEVRE